MDGTILVRMTTKRAMRGISIFGALIPLFVWLNSKTGSGVFVIFATISSFGAMGLLLYAAFRERVEGDTSERIPRRSATMILCVVGLYVAFVFYRALR